MRFFFYSLLLLGLLAGVGIIYFRHETQAAEQLLKAEQSGTQSRAAAPALLTLSLR